MCSTLKVPAQGNFHVLSLIYRLCDLISKKYVSIPIYSTSSILLLGKFAFLLEVGSINRGLSGKQLSMQNYRQWSSVRGVLFAERRWRQSKLHHKSQHLRLSQPNLQEMGKLFMSLYVVYVFAVAKVRCLLFFKDLMPPKASSAYRDIFF